MTTATETTEQPETSTDWLVQCLQCHLLGTPSQIPDIGWGPHCADIDGCTTRWSEGGLPQEARSPVIVLPSPEAEDELKPLPIEEAASAARQQAARENLARWAPGETLGDEDEPVAGGDGETPGEPREAPEKPQEPEEVPPAAGADPAADDAQADAEAPQ